MQLSDVRFYNSSTTLNLVQLSDVRFYNSSTTHWTWCSFLMSDSTTLLQHTGLGAAF
ncbi:hypothetical protein DPMN_169945 [Dreissena polymorpha]|uniref:Uncharacterized protein n=1 Tax=Dreissena polymorpha TaxID=45954 RepID=A0A9D4DWG0_DREPO|nr:hypothetical protein DPMN_169945 [Dreissena polymorpha]